MIVVSNTSPLTNLAAIGQFDLLHRLYSGVDITDGVWDELNAMENRWPGGEEVAAARWIKRYSVRNQLLVNALMRDIDRGEAESIELKRGSSLLLTFYNGFRGGSNLLSLLRHKIILIGQITIISGSLLIALCQTIITCLFRHRI